LKGNSTYEFYCYDISENSWTTEAVIPALGASGRPKKVAKGASLAATGGSIYATKGNRTTDFYQFDPGNNAWFTKAAVPLDGQALNAGTGAAAVEILSVPYVYLLKGSSTCAFYRYNTVTNIWETMADAPLGASGRTFTDGSAIAYDPDHNVIYALKGNRNEFYAYDVGADQWTTKTALPIAGASGNKKAKAGAGLAVLNGYVYVQKGNRTLDLWRYDPAHDAWAQLDNMPVGGGKKITSGGALTAGDGKVYAVKGDYTLEFYSYTPATFGCAQPPMHSDEQSARSNPVSDLSLRITPNPISTGTTISYSLPKPGDVSLKLYDMTGKLVTTLATGGQTAGTHSLSFRAQRGNLVNGIYILKLESDNTTASQKLILQ
jgi:N-acetylneuraminic acid mutarotase